MNINHKTVLFVLIFALLFVSISWLAPVLYANYAPQEQIVDINRFEPQDTTTDAESHVICWDRDANTPAKADVTMELLLVTGDEKVREITTIEYETYLEDNVNIRSFETPLPEKELDVGTYKYIGVLDVQLADGRVERTFSKESETFRVMENESALPEPNC